MNRQLLHCDPAGIALAFLHAPQHGQRGVVQYGTCQRWNAATTAQRPRRG
jgi:hypothetical protein